MYCLQPLTPRDIKLIKQQQKLLQKLQKKVEREAEQRRRQEEKKRKREEEQQRKDKKKGKKWKAQVMIAICLLRRGQHINLYYDWFELTNEICQ